MLASAGEDGTIRFWSLATHELLQTAWIHQRPVTSVAWRLEEQALVSASLGGTVQLVDVELPPSDAYQIRRVSCHLAASANYDPYGSPEGAALPSPFGYTGELTDPATGSQFATRKRVPGTVVPARPGQPARRRPAAGPDRAGLQLRQRQPGERQRPQRAGLCDLAPLQPFCQGVGNEIRNAVGGVIGYWNHLTAQAGDYVRRTLVSALFGANGLLVKAAQSDFAAGVNDGVVDFARGLAGVPGAVKDHLDTLNYYDQHPRTSPQLLQGLVFRALKENLSQNPDVQLIQGEVQLLKGLWDVVQGLRKALACGAVARGLGHALPP